MPRKTDKEMMRLMKDLKDGREDMTLTPEELMEQRPELMRYKDQMVAYIKYIERMKIDIVKGNSIGSPPPAAAPPAAAPRPAPVSPAATPHRGHRSVPLAAGDFEVDILDERLALLAVGNDIPSLGPNEMQQDLRVELTSWSIKMHART
jgi:hypothetical protein